MARGDHPMRTPVYGGLLIVAAMVGATVAVDRGADWPGWARTVVLIVAVVAILIGALLTLRDRTPPRRPR
jgi:peptidoglycan/LPS O-acetylase OafA/YrhL